MLTVDFLAREGDRSSVGYTLGTGSRLKSMDLAFLDDGIRATSELNHWTYHVTDLTVVGLGAG